MFVTCIYTIHMHMCICIYIYMCTYIYIHFNLHITCAYTHTHAFSTSKSICQNRVISRVVGSPLRTQYSQPAIFTVEYALAELWRSRGLEPCAVSWRIFTGNLREIYIMIEIYRDMVWMIHNMMKHMECFMSCTASLPNMCLFASKILK